MSEDGVDEGEDGEAVEQRVQQPSPEDATAEGLSVLREAVELWESEHRLRRRRPVEEAENEGRRRGEAHVVAAEQPALHRRRRRPSAAPGDEERLRNSKTDRANIETRYTHLLTHQSDVECGVLVEAEHDHLDDTVVVPRAVDEQQLRQVTELECQLQIELKEPTPIRL